MAPDVKFANATEKKEFTKYTRFLIYKAIQVIVESRKGNKIEGNTKPQIENEWFNLRIPDDAEVNKAVKNVFPSDRVLETLELGLNVYISLNAEDNVHMCLEMWTLHLDKEECDVSWPTMSSIYSKMSSLLKCLITSTRITPAYQLSRRQSSDSFTISYSVYKGENKHIGLGKAIVKKDVGILKTPRGKIVFTVTYRTDLSITPNKLAKNTGLILKSDHFEMSPKRVIYDPDKKEVSVKRVKIDINKPLRIAAFVDELLIKRVFEEFLEKFPIPNYRAIQLENTPTTEVKSDTDKEETKDGETSKIPPIEPESVQAPKDPVRQGDDDCDGKAPLKLLYFPFADRHPIRDLAEFYKDFFNAPNLKLTEDLEPSPSRPDTPKHQGYQVEETKDVSDNLSRELVIYESSVQEFDELLAEMCRSTEWSGS